MSKMQWLFYKVLPVVGIGYISGISWYSIITSGTRPSPFAFNKKNGAPTTGKVMFSADISKYISAFPPHAQDICRMGIHLKAVIDALSYDPENTLV